MRTYVGKLCDTLIRAGTNNAHRVFKDQFNFHLTAFGKFPMAIWNKLLGGDGQNNDEVAEIKKNLNDGTAVMLDVRRQEERDTVHLKGSIFIPVADIQSLDAGMTELPNLPKDKIVYCH